MAAKAATPKLEVTETASAEEAAAITAALQQFLVDTAAQPELGKLLNAWQREGLLESRFNRQLLTPWGDHSPWGK